MYPQATPYKFLHHPHIFGNGFLYEQYSLHTSFPIVWWARRESHPLELKSTGFTDRGVYFNTLLTHIFYYGIISGPGDGTRTRTRLLPGDFKSPVSANSTTPG